LSTALTNEPESHSEHEAREQQTSTLPLNGDHESFKKRLVFNKEWFWSKRRSRAPYGDCGRGTNQCEIYQARASYSVMPNHSQIPGKRDQDEWSRHPTDKPEEECNSDIEQDGNMAA
jgi:hypothetical protein